MKVVKVRGTLGMRVDQGKLGEVEKVGMVVVNRVAINLQVGVIVEVVGENPMLLKVGVP